MEPARTPRDLGCNALRSATDLPDSTTCCIFLAGIRLETELPAMAIKPCKDCGEQVSSRADECPHCGRWMIFGRLEYLFGINLLIFLLLVFFVLQRD